MRGGGGRVERGGWDVMRFLVSPAPVEIPTESGCGTPETYSIIRPTGYVKDKRDKYVLLAI